MPVELIKVASIAAIIVLAFVCVRYNVRQRINAWIDRKIGNVD